MSAGTDNRKLKILIVENDEDEQFFMSEAFAGTGCFEIVGSAGNGDELLELINAPHQALPDFILSDLNMPGRNGLDILTDIRRHMPYSEIPVVITSTSTMPSVMEKCKAAGAYAYIAKPETFTEYNSFAMALFQRMSEAIRK